MTNYGTKAYQIITLEMLAEPTLDRQTLDTTSPRYHRHKTELAFVMSGVCWSVMAPWRYTLRLQTLL